MKSSRIKQVRQSQLIGRIELAVAPLRTANSTTWTDDAPDLYTRPTLGSAGRFRGQYDDRFFHPEFRKGRLREEIFNPLTHIGSSIPNTPPNEAEES